MLIFGRDNVEKSRIFVFNTDKLLCTAIFYAQERLYIGPCK